MPKGTFIPTDTPPYSVNDYDSEGKTVEIGVFLHFDSARIKVADNLEEFEEFKRKLAQLTPEIRDAWDQVN